MTTFTPLAIILGILLGGGGAYIYFKKKQRKLIKKLEEDGENPKSEYNKTLKSEGSDDRKNHPKKVGDVQETVKEVPVTVPAPTPNVPMEEKKKE